MKGLAIGLGIGLLVVIAFFIALPILIIAFFATAAFWLVVAGVQITVGLLRGLGNGIVAVWQFFLRIPGQILRFFSNAPSWLIDAGWRVLKGLWQGITDFWNGPLSSFLGSLWGKFRHAVHGIGDVLVDIGERIMGGLLRGIKAGFEAVKSFVGGIAGGIRDLKGPPEYDSRLLIDNGQLIMQGFQKGLMRGWEDTKKLLGTMTSELSGTTIGGPTIAPGAFEGATGFGGAPTKTITVEEGAIQVIVQGNVDSDVLPDMERMLEVTLNELVQTLETQ
jgi:phage-related protein